MMFVTNAVLDVSILTGAGPRRTNTRPLQVMRTLHSLPAQSATARSRGVLAGGLSDSLPPHAEMAVAPSAAATNATARVSARRTGTVWRRSGRGVGGVAGAARRCRARPEFSTQIATTGRAPGP
jgi:hypothetical protein